MFEAFAAIFIFIAIIAVTAVLFGGWLIVTLVRVLFRGASYLLGDEERQPMSLPGQNNATGPRAIGRPPSPAAAGFGRRCGRQMPRAQRVAVRRAAMW